MFTGNEFDIDEHLPLCRFFNESRSITSATTSIGKEHGKDIDHDRSSLPSSHAPVSPSGPLAPLRVVPRHLQRTYNPLSPPQSSPVMDFLPRRGLQEEQDPRLGLEGLDESFSFPEMDIQAFEDELDRYDEEQQDGDFSQLMEDLDVNDDITAQEEPLATSEHPHHEEVSESQPTLTPLWRRQQLEPEEPTLQPPESQEPTLSPPWRRQQLEPKVPSPSLPQRPHVNTDAGPSRRRRIVGESDDEESAGQGTGKKIVVGIQTDLKGPRATSKAAMDDCGSEMTSPPLSQEFQERRGVRTQLPLQVQEDQLDRPRAHRHRRSPMPQTHEPELPATQSPRTAQLDSPSEEDASALFANFASQFCNAHVPVCLSRTETRPFLPLLVYTPRYTKRRRRVSTKAKNVFVFCSMVTKMR